MSIRQMYEAVLIELNKENAPNILLEDFNYLANRAVYQYINKRYNIYDTSQQTTDDLRVLKATAILPVHQTPYQDKLSFDVTSMFMDATYTAELPNDYYHLLNCLCFYKVNDTNKCYNKNTIARFAATRLTADTWSQVVDNYWLRPTYKRPYYYIHNVNSPLTEDTPPENVPTNPLHEYEGIKNAGTDKDSTIETARQIIYLTDFKVQSSYFDVPPTKENIYVLQEMSSGAFYLRKSIKVINDGIITYKWDNPISPITTPKYLSYKEKYYELTETDLKEASFPHPDLFKTIDINGFLTKQDEESVTEKYPFRKAQVRYGNASKPLIEIRYGEDNTTFELVKIMVDYIKAPQHIRLTQEQVDRTLDYSQILEFPDYVCQEIINELVHIIMENIGDQRLQTHPVVSQSIATQQQTQQE